MGYLYLYLLTVFLLCFNACTFTSSVTACSLCFPRPSSHPKSVLVISMFLFSGQFNERYAYLAACRVTIRL